MSDAHLVFVSPFTDYVFYVSKAEKTAGHFGRRQKLAWAGDEADSAPGGPPSGNLAAEALVRRLQAGWQLAPSLHGGSVRRT